MTNLRPSHASGTDGDHIFTEAYGTRHEEVLHGLGFSVRSASSDRILDMSVASDKEKAKVSSKLLDAGIAFSRGRERCSTEVFWEQGLKRGPFQSIAWRG